MLSCASFFAGVGGLDIAFESTGLFRTVYANEFDKYPADTYELNSKSSLAVDRRDIQEVQADTVPNFDIALAGFPCQPFSVAGSMGGFTDTRGMLFFDLLRILAAKKPKVVFLENVKNLVTHDNGNTFSTIQYSLRVLGYSVHYKVLNAKTHGNIPQNRERVYIVCFLDKEASDRFHFPEPIQLTTSVQDIIDFDTKVADCYYYTPERHKFYNALHDGLQADDPEHPSVYQWRYSYTRRNKSGVIPTITATAGTGGNNVGIVKTRYGIRKMTPLECFKAQGFPNDFKLPETQPDSRLYKQSGNTVCIPVIVRIAQEIANALCIKEGR